MKVLAIKAKKLPKGIVYSTFDEMFEKYKNQCKKPNWRTIEGFYLEWLDCITIKQFKECIFAYPDTEQEEMLRKKYTVLDENNLNY